MSERLFKKMLLSWRLKYLPRNYDRVNDLDGFQAAALEIQRKKGGLDNNLGIL